MPRTIGIRIQALIPRPQEFDARATQVPVGPFTCDLGAAMAAPVQAQAFEGTLTFVAHGKDGDKTITEWVKGSSTRYDFSGATAGGMQGTMIIDGAARTRTVVMPAGGCT